MRRVDVTAVRQDPAGRPDSSEDGLTLIELIVYGVLLVLVLAVVGGILISTLLVGSQVRDSTLKTSEAQLVAKSLETGIRNSSAFEVTDLVDDQLLMARTAGSEQPLVWRCTAWYYSAAEQTMYYLRSDTPITPPLSAADVAGWLVLGERIVPTSPTRIFTRVDSQLEIAFEGHTPDSAVVTVNSSAAARAGVWETAPCF